MATRQRISGGGVAKTCPKCGAELWDDGSCLPCDWSSVPAQPARYSGDQPGDQPSDWRRWATGTIASLLGFLALILLGDAASCDPDAFLGCLFADLERYIAYSLLLMATPFALATVLPFGRLRRVTVALGSAMLAGALAIPAASVVAHEASAGREAGIPLVLGAGAIAFCLALFSAYRLAR